MDDLRPRLIATSTPRRPEAVALVLHGGGSREPHVPVSPTQTSVLRMVPVAARLALDGRRRLTVRRLLNSSRGWSGRPTPVDDALWALDSIRDELGDLPVALVGHSLGGRAALLAAQDERVRSVVGLATWLSADDRVPPLPGRHVLLVHGDADRVAGLRSAARAADRLATSTRAGFVTVRGGSHSMVRRHRAFDGLAARWVSATLLGGSPGSTLRPLLTGEEHAVEV